MSLRALRRLAPVPIWAAAALFALAPINSVDFFWHLKLGAIIAETHHIPTTDTFSSVHPERPYVQLQWLWELGAYLVHEAAGLRGIRVAQALLLTGSFVALTYAARRAAGEAAALLLGALGLVLFEDRMQARPSALILGFVALSIPWLVARVPSRTPGTLLGIGLLACLWSNLHGGEALLLPLCLGARTLGFAMMSRASEPPRSALLASAAQLGVASAGCALSPTLLAGLASWRDAIGPQLATGNQEWLPSYTMLRYGVSVSHLLIALGPTLVALLYVRLLVRVPSARAPAEVLVAAGLTVLAHHAVRNAFLCLVPLLFILRHARHAHPRPPRASRALALGAAVLWVAAVRNHVVDGYGGLSEARQALASELAPNAFPEELAAFMREAAITGPIFNDGRWGGYLIWTQWPRCAVFADSRQDFTEEMWALMLAAQSPDARPRALSHAFGRWGLELAVFRGPTFPVVRPDPDWQLLFKAGDQELYQHRRGAHAATNLARTRAWLARTRGEAPPDDAPLAQAVTEAGAARWLAAPYRRWLAARAARLQEATDAATRTQGLRLAANLRYDAGDYAGARTLLQAVLAEAPRDAVARYRAALASYALGDEDAARMHLTQLPDPGALSRHQRERLAVLAAALRGR